METVSFKKVNQGDDVNADIHQEKQQEKQPAAPVSKSVGMASVSIPSLPEFDEPHGGLGLQIPKTMLVHLTEIAKRKNMSRSYLIKLVFADFINSEQGTDIYK